MLELNHARYEAEVKAGLHDKKKKKGGAGGEIGGDDDNTVNPEPSPGGAKENGTLDPSGDVHEDRQIINQLGSQEELREDWIGVRKRISVEIEAED